MAHSPYSASMACQRAKKTNLSDHVSEYDTPHHRKARAKLRLEHPLVRLDSSTLASSTTDPKNRQVGTGRGPGGFGAQGVEIEFMVFLLDPSATEGRDVLRLAAPMQCYHPKSATRRRLSTTLTPATP